MDVIGVGIATIDVVYEVNGFPQGVNNCSVYPLQYLSTFMRIYVEDTKIRAITQRKARGGNATNALVVASQLGVSCRWMGTWINPLTDSDASFVQTELNNAHIDSSYATILSHGAMPVSFIMSNQLNGSRTIIHHRDLEELTYDQFCTQVKRLLGDDLTKSYWFHFEGRNLINVLDMMKYLRQYGNQCYISVEIEARRNEWEIVQCLFLYTDIVFFSKDYIQNKLLYTTFDEFILWFTLQKAMERTTCVIIAPWGSDGAYFTNLTPNGVQPPTILHVPVFQQLDYVMDSVGAGDAFIGAALAAFSTFEEDWKTDHSLMSIVAFACRVATQKCQVMGLVFTSENVLLLKQMLNAVNH